MSPAPLFVAGLGAGLLAGGAGCAVVQGGLLAAAVTRRTARGPDDRVDPRPLAPAIAFLTGKLASHTVLGAALGTFGSTLHISPRVRAVTMLVAAALMVFFALELFGLPLARRLAAGPPVAWTRLVRRSADTDWMLTPLLLGLATVLLPCGVTLSMELLAVTSTTPQDGAAVMAGFVLGTAPLFTLLGYLLRRSAQILRGRLRAATGVAILAVATFTAVSGLTLGGWGAGPTPQDSSPGGGGAAPTPDPAAAAPPVGPAGPAQVLEVRVLDNAYSPNQVTAASNRHTSLVLVTSGTYGCTRDFVIPSRGIERVLPATGRTTIDLGTPPPGRLAFSCAMGEHTGVISFHRS